MKMIRIGVLIALALCAASARAQVSVAQHTSARIGTAATSVSVAFGSNITAGNYVLVTCAWYSNGETVTVTDNASGGSNTYSDTGSGAVTNATGPVWIQTFKAKIVNGGGTTPTVSCNLNNSTSLGINVAIAEISGADATTFVDSFTSATPNPAANTQFSAGTVATSAANTLIYAACFPNHTIVSQGLEYAKLEATIDDLWTAVGAANTGAAGNYLPRFQSGSSADNDACNVVAIKAASQTASTGVYPGNGYAQGTDTSSTSRSWTHTVAGGSNGLLLVKLLYRNAQSGNPTVTYNSVSMSRVQFSCYNNGTSTCIDVYQLTSPASGAHTVSVTYTSSTDGHEASEDFSNVNQTTPVTGIQTDLTSSSGSSVTVTSRAGDWVSSQWTGISGPTSLCAASSTNSDYVFKTPTFGVWGGFGHATGASTVTMNWTTSSTASCPGSAVGDNHAHMAFDIQSATAPARTYPHHTHII